MFEQEYDATSTQWILLSLLTWNIGRASLLQGPAQTGRLSSRLYIRDNSLLGTENQELDHR